MRFTEKSNANIKFIISKYKKLIKRNVKALEKEPYTDGVIHEIFRLLNAFKDKSKKINFKIFDDDSFDVSSYVREHNIKSKFFPGVIYDYVTEHLNNRVHIVFKIKGTVFDLSFMFNANSVEMIKTMRSYVKQYIPFILHWLLICCNLTDEKLEHVNINIFLTPFSKKLPPKEGMIGESINVNSGYTSYYKGSPFKDIVIFRYEEWFKVFIHETIHAFEFDLCAINIDRENERITNMFPFLSSTCNINESYTEFWANVLNTSILCFYTCSGDRGTFKNLFKVNMELERIFAIQQTKKLFAYYNLDLSLLKNDSYNTTMKHLFKESTNIFSYYVIKSILLVNSYDFMEWCRKTNNVLFNIGQPGAKEFSGKIIEYFDSSQTKKYLKLVKGFNNTNNLQMCVLEYILK